MIKIHVETDPKFNLLNNKIILDIVIYLFKSKNIKDINLSFIFGDDNLLNSLKKEFFKKDQFTDVIAFRLNDYEEKNIEGEIYISLPRAKENSVKFGEPLNKELGRLIIHGCLHLLGFKDESDNEKADMTKQEDYYLGKIEWDHLYG